VNSITGTSVKAMTQTMILKNAPQQTSLLSLNMRQVDDLFPGFTAGDFAVVYGSPSIEYLTSHPSKRYVFYLKLKIDKC